VDWGVQGEEYRFERGEDYRVASLALQWTLFNGGQREAQVHGAAAALRDARTQAEEAAAQVELDVRVAWQGAAVAREALQGARDRHAAARRTWELVARRHAIGAASLLELLDARTNLTNAGSTTCSPPTIP
jgi:outer membrane protein TolC